MRHKACIPSLDVLHSPSPMKYVFVIGDGMGDYPHERLGGKTVLEYARTPHLDALAQAGTLGLIDTIPPGLPAGSDVANLSLLGYDPQQYYTGRAPLEAASMGITLGKKDLAIRCNLVTLSDDLTVMKDYSAGHISTEYAHALLDLIAHKLGNTEFEFYRGVSYRHLLVWRNAPITLSKLELTPPHEIPDHPIAPYLPKGSGSSALLSLIERSWEVLRGHQANSIWLWGAGYAPQMPTFTERFGLSGAVISAVDLIKGLGVYAKLTVMDIPGATGYLDTNYAGKVDATLRALSQKDFVYTHIEAPDECGHQGRLDLKIQAIEDFDTQIVGPLLFGLAQTDREFVLVVTTDHYTPVSTRVHVAAPVPFVIYRSYRKESNLIKAFHEKAAQASGLHLRGHELLSFVLDS